MGVLPGWPRQADSRADGRAPGVPPHAQRDLQQLRPCGPGCHPPVRRLACHAGRRLHVCVELSGLRGCSGRGGELHRTQPRSGAEIHVCRLHRIGRGWRTACLPAAPPPVCAQAARAGDRARAPPQRRSPPRRPCAGALPGLPRQEVPLARRLCRDDAAAARRPADAPAGGFLLVSAAEQHLGRRRRRRRTLDRLPPHGMDDAPPRAARAQCAGRLLRQRHRLLHAHGPRGRLFLPRAASARYPRIHRARRLLATGCRRHPRCRSSEQPLLECLPFLPRPGIQRPSRRAGAVQQFDRRDHGAPLGNPGAAILPGGSWRQLCHPAVMAGQRHARVSGVWAQGCAFAQGGQG
mmetsp:Transcript_26877/g.68955  ORF Transcript_26877/g.68955 Transcript_26877/m.68955 type:complete len:350 (+) Transcript_26877:942-1991(+)